MKISDGFIYGAAWKEPHSRVAIPVHTVEKVVFDCGNQPPADRVYRLHNLPSIDLLTEPEDQ